MGYEELLARREGKFIVRWDVRRGSVLCELSGFWNAADATAFSLEVHRAVKKSRTANGKAIALFDTTDAGVQSEELMNVGKGLNILQRCDRVAVVVSSSLLKMQMKRMPSMTDEHDFFLARSSAETWLYAHMAVATI